MIAKIQIRRDTSANWDFINPTLGAGEIALDTTISDIKIGDGSTRWKSLPYAGLFSELPWKVVSTNNYTPADGERILIDTSTVTTILLPANPLPNYKVQLGDYTGNFLTVNVTVARNGNKILGLDENLILNVSNAIITLEYVNVSKGWMVS